MATDISAWLQALGFDKYAGLFAEQEIDLSVVAELTELDLEKLGIPLRPRKKLIKAMRNSEVARRLSDLHRDAKRVKLCA